MGVNDAARQLHLKISDFVLLVVNMIDGTILTSSYSLLDPRLISLLPVHTGTAHGGESCL